MSLFRTWFCLFREVGSLQSTPTQALSCRVITFHDRRFNLGFAKLARVLVRFDHVACVMVNANHSMI